MGTQRSASLLVLLTCAGLGHALRPTELRPRPAPAAVLSARRPRAVLVASVASEPPKSPAGAGGVAVGWGVLGVVGILASAIKRLAPIAAQPFLQKDLTLIQWGLCAAACFARRP